MIQQEILMKRKSSNNPKEQRLTEPLRSLINNTRPLFAQELSLINVRPESAFPTHTPTEMKFEEQQ
jgi:hypothetical protein